MKHGSDVTTRQIADAAGVAEGTLFRVFEDKDAIIDAAVAKFMDPTPTLARLAQIPEGLAAFRGCRGEVSHTSSSTSTHRRVQCPHLGVAVAMVNF